MSKDVILIIGFSIGISGAIIIGAFNIYNYKKAKKCKYGIISVWGD